jgi:YHS domain-containing protein
MKKIILLLFVTVACSAHAQNERFYNVDRSVLAIHGYDPVGYQEGKAIKGNEKYEVKYQGVVYRFSTVEHLNKFQSDPTRYEPAYGGWCAFAMGSYGEQVKVDPETFKVVNGKTYLFYNFYLKNTLNDWNKDEKNLLRKGDMNWIKIKTKK